MISYRFVSISSQKGVLFLRHLVVLIQIKIGPHDIPGEPEKSSHFENS